MVIIKSEEIENKIREVIDSQIRKFLHNKNFICTFNDYVDFKFNQDFKDGQIGMKIQAINSRCRVDNIAVIRMDLTVNKFQLTLATIKNFLTNHFNNFTKFSKIIDKFLLMGLDSSKFVDINEVQEEISLDGFFSGPESETLNNPTSTEIMSAIIRARDRLIGRKIPDPFTLLSDNNVISDIPRIELIDKPICVLDHRLNSQSDDYNIVCFPVHNRNNFYLVEKEIESVNVIIENDRVVVYWGGALKINNIACIQRIHLKYEK